MGDGPGCPSPYPKMAPVDQYLMEKNAEIQLAQSAAPESISSEVTILVLGRHGELAYCRLAQLPSRWAYKVMPLHDEYY
jgi:hypothetical protein